MRRIALLLLSLASAACVVQPVDPAGKACDPSHPCPDGYDCRSGACVLPFDGGPGPALDAALPDAAEVDSGTPEDSGEPEDSGASLDAATPEGQDAGPADAALPDSGSEPDAGALPDGGTSGCSIGGISYAAYAPDPDNSCQSCQPATSPTTWSPLPADTACLDDGNPCTSDTCDGAGTCQHGARADGTVCGVGKNCQSGVCNTGCLIGGVHVDSGIANAANVCQVCDPLRSATGWSNAPVGASCPDEPNPCTSDGCDGAGNCQHTAYADGTSCAADSVCTSGACRAGCFIGGSFFDSGAVCAGNACQGCEPLVAKGAWSNLVTGTPCPDDNNPCTADACNGSGACQHPKIGDGTSCGSSLTCLNGQCGSGCNIQGQQYASGDSNPGNVCQVCDPASSTSLWSSAAAGTACPDDSNPCTTDACDAAGACQHPFVLDGTTCGATSVCATGACEPGCYIGTSYYATGAVQAGSPCMACDPTRSKSGWSALPVNTPCTDDGNSCTTDLCNSSGSCLHASVADGTSCSASKVCHSGACVSGCFIGTSFYQGGVVNTANPCQDCVPSTSTTQWTNLSDGTTCPGGSCLAGSCTTGTCTAAKQTFTTGGGTTVVVPSGCGHASVELWGGGGAGRGPPDMDTGGGGGYIGGTFAVTPASTLYVFVGGGGSLTAGGVNGGGANGGGGCTALSLSAALASSFIVAGGGGGGGTDDCGGAGGGTNGKNGDGYNNAKGGTQSAGGAGGTSNGPPAGGAGSAFQGGAGTANAQDGGGCGYFGGGGGYAGGGGSSWANTTLVSSVVSLAGDEDDPGGYAESGPNPTGKSARGGPDTGGPGWDGEVIITWLN